MNFVEPIRDKNKLEDILNYLEKDRPKKYYILFVLGLYSGLRISDILPLQVKHVKSRDHISIREKKTGKAKKVTLNKFLKKKLDSYVEDMEDWEYLIPNSKVGNHPISRQQAYKVIKETCERFDVEHIGTHSLRKTFGYHYYQKTKDVAILQNIFNHSDPSVTLRYIGINQDTISEAYASMNFFKG
ncbi:site-specific integrase [Peptostreptococcus equinus]|uniref:Site-specific integrase n=1 Tax=Peptostreptococcus equinus TaxID=3003601 RepID=A0ABY7JQI4_9FIRM|nr:site-specific integrase [Peptostreptococcus sp. CBA3647]WAW14759.1 site-specific integrase [Peptostreptococcus sp. CBA3647]